MEAKCARLQWMLVFVLVTRTCIAEEQAQNGVEASRSAMEQSLRNDATLTDVCFVDATTGWAVGDRGVIWHTADGGVSWQQQRSSLSCRLNSVCFIDHRRGWAAGGSSRPFADGTQGVVLRTSDGGTTWQLGPALVMPLLSRVKFFDPNVGAAVGDSAPGFPAGAFMTQDGGQSWQPMAADQAAHWLTGDFVAPEAGAVAGPAGQFATVANRRIIHSPLATASLRSAQAMRLVAPAGGWLVGEGGLLMTTHDLGHSWQSPTVELPDNAGDHFDFHAVAVHGSHVWVTGSPGTRVFHSGDGGQTWAAFATGCRTPLRALSFMDGQRGWAVGDLGCILATADGGRTWRMQRAGGLRVALLATFAHATDVPVELVALQSASEGYITAVDILHAASNDNDPNSAFSTTRRDGDAMILAGASSAETAWRFPLPPDDLALEPTDLAAALNRVTDGRAMQQLENHLVRQLRMWRPDVVVTHPAAPQTNQSMAALVQQLVVRAVDAAADPSQYPLLTSEAGLDPWQVKKLYGVLPPGSRGDEVVVTSRFSPWLATSLAEWAAPARRLLFASHSLSPDTYELRLLAGEPLSAGAAGGLFAGIQLARGSDARRDAAELPANDLEDLRHLATRRQHLQKLLERTEGNAVWAGQVATLIEGLDPTAAGDLLFQLAEDYRDTGRLDLAADTYYLLARRFPDHSLAEASLRWLVQFYASSEAAHRSAARGLTNVRETTIDGDSDSTQPRAPIQPLSRDGVEQTAAVSPIAADAAPAVGLSRDDRLRRAAQLADYLQAQRPALYAEPAIRFAEVSAQRQLGYANAAKRYFLTIGQHATNDPWRRCAETEQWLASPNDAPPPKSLATCRRALEPPQLDGKLDEPVWTVSDKLRLTSPDRVTNSRVAGESKSRGVHAGAEIRLAYDNNFLYLAVTCPKEPGDYRADDQPRPRDADLQQHDRVTLRLDIDRDFSTAFEFTVDHRGWTHDSCWDDAKWNPAWYVAAASDDTSWAVEAAVPLDELTTTPPAAKHVWAASARRVIPRLGYESWAGTAADADSPDQFGLLIFE